MTPKMIVSALAAAALVTAGSAAAWPGKGGGHGPGVSAKAKGKLKAGGRVKVAKRSLGIAGTAAQPRPKGRLNSQGLANASPRALERASASSVLAGGRIVSGPLAGLTPGTPIAVNGSTVGTVERIVPSGGGKVANVLVRLAGGRIVPLSPRSLSLEGETWTATSLDPAANRR